MLLSSPGQPEVRDEWLRWPPALPALRVVTPFALAAKRRVSCVGERSERLGQSEILLSALQVILQSVTGSGVAEHAASPPALILTDV